MCVHVREWESMRVHPCIIRILRQTLMQRSRALVMLRQQPVEQGWRGRARLQGPQCRLCVSVAGEGDSTARRHRAPRPHPSQRPARKANSLGAGKPAPGR